MRTSTSWFSILLAAPLVISSCSRPQQATDSPPAPELVAGKEGTSEIVFHGRYFLSKECRELPDGSRALGLFGVCEVVEVQKGDLTIKRLLGVRVPEDVKEGEVHTFRWKLSLSDAEHLKKAQDGGFTGYWVDGDLELVRARERER